MQVLELGIVVHSVVIGLSLGASNNTCTIKGLVAALCFHQIFEGMSLGGCILQVLQNSMLSILFLNFIYLTYKIPHSIKKFSLHNCSYTGRIQAIEEGNYGVLLLSDNSIWSCLRDCVVKNVQRK